MKSLALVPAAFLLITATDVPPAPTTVTVQTGQTLSEIADHHDTPGGWPRLAYVNRGRIQHPDLIQAGVTLRLPATDGRKWIPRPEPKASRSSNTSSAASSSSGSSAGTPTGDVWSQLAACESGGDWGANTGNGYYGGLQHSLTTWRAFGGSGYPHEASASEQIAVATRVQASQGWGAWPACSEKLGLR